MKTKFKTVIAVLALFVLFFMLLQSCTKEAQGTVVVTNSQFKVELLFEVDGCKVYRFEDGGHYRYFTTCKNSSMSWNEKTGKVSREVNIQTK